MIRTYPLQHFANGRKQEQVLELLRAYRKTAGRVASLQWRAFYMEGRFDKNLGLKDLDSPLSERYKQVCQYQVVGILESWLGNRQNDFKRAVWGSTLPQEVKLQLFYINKYKLWYRKEVSIPKFTPEGKRVEGEHVAVDAATLRLARNIFRGIARRHRKPRFSRINMALDEKVAVVSKATPQTGGGEKSGGKAGRAKEFDYWVKLSTLQKGKPIYIPLKTNPYFDSRGGELKHFCQINSDGFGGIRLYLLKDLPQKEYAPEVDTVGLDLGLKTLLATDRGDLLGRGLWDRLTFYDRALTGLARNRQKQELKVSSRRYARLRRKLKSYLKNEVNRVFNRLIELYHPAELVVEKLDFRSPELSKRMNRLLSNFGKGTVEAKLRSLAEEYGITVTYVNPAYTSQTCPNPGCGYVDRRNRKAQPEFECKYCGYTRNADVVGARNVRARSSDPKLANPYTRRKDTLHLLVGRFLRNLPEPEVERFSRPHSRAEGLLAGNPYQGVYREELKEFLPVDKLL